MEFEEQPIHQVITEIKGGDRTLEAKYERVGNGYYQDEQAWRSCEI